nr:MAG TPA: hypothetical protein [Caudoviricetes sp.]
MPDALNCTSLHSALIRLSSFSSIAIAQSSNLICYNLNFYIFL